MALTLERLEIVQKILSNQIEHIKYIKEAVKDPEEEATAVTEALFKVIRISISYLQPNEVNAYLKSKDL